MLIKFWSVLYNTHRILMKSFSKCLSALAYQYIRILWIESIPKLWNCNVTQDRDNHRSFWLDYDSLIDRSKILRWTCEGWYRFAVTVMVQWNSSLRCVTLPRHLGIICIVSNKIFESPKIRRLKIQSWTLSRIIKFIIYMYMYYEISLVFNITTKTWENIAYFRSNKERYQKRKQFYSWVIRVSEKV